MTILFLDFETSGLNPYHDDIIEIAMKVYGKDIKYYLDFLLLEVLLLDFLRLVFFLFVFFLRFFLFDFPPPAAAAFAAAASDCRRS